jgi:hypothetical protein
VVNLSDGWYDAIGDVVHRTIERLGFERPSTKISEPINGRVLVTITSQDGRTYQFAALVDEPYVDLSLDAFLRLTDQLRVVPLYGLPERPSETWRDRPPLL